MRRARATTDDARRAQTCYGVSTRSERALDASTARVMRTGDVAGRYRYLCVGRGARRVPFYPEGRRTPTLEERRRGTDFPVCQGLEILIAEKAAAREAMERREGRGREGTRAEAEAEARREPVERAGSTASPGEEMLARFNRSAGKIASNMRRHAAFIGDGAYALFVGRR